MTTTIVSHGPTIILDREALTKRQEYALEVYARDYGFSAVVETPDGDGAFLSEYYTKVTGAELNAPNVIEINFTPSTGKER